MRRYVQQLIDRLGLSSRPQRPEPFVLVACVAVAGVLIATSGYFVNWTGSLPRGLYQRTEQPAERGAIVQVCPPEDEAQFALQRGYLEAGSCPAGTKMLGKHLVGVPGDTVTVTRRRVLVNGEPLPKSRPLRTDSQGRSVEPEYGTHVLRPGEYFVFSGRHARSYDSRYLGPVTDLRGVVESVLVSR